ncbi:MAG: hypothetical protein HC915_21005 [Anaerolineae bacterium]|nr:hypothetical protein [Anaerolineae bacterium]
MELPPELTRIPNQSLQVLRYMGEQGMTEGDADSLAEATGMSAIGIGKAIRGLVTKGYLEMNAVTYVYYLTQKGQDAVRDVAAYYQAQASGGSPSANSGSTIAQELVIVAPDAVSSGGQATLHIGLVAPSTLQHHTQLVLRLNALGGQLSPAQLTLDLAPGQLPAPLTTQLSSDGSYNGVRVRVEALQMVDDTDIAPVGSLFFDLAVGQRSAERAWYGTLALLPG